jgi:glycosyltransferase involved in cell wall biosynthesis
MPLYNNSKFLAEAIQSLRAQTYPNFVVVMLDDCSTDKTPIIAGRWVKRDHRFSFRRSKKRLGMVAAWRRVYELSRVRAPRAQYFAWVSDHDRWDPEWLATLVAELDGDMALVMAYPRTVKISPRGTPRAAMEPTLFETVGMSDPLARWDHTCRRLIGAGNMIYGLFRIDVLKKVGVFRGVLLPDRLLQVELALLGQIRQVPQVLWYRRYLAASSLGRQRGTLFGARGAPWWTYLPWWFVHAVAICRSHGGESRDERLPKHQVLRMSVRYAWSQIQIVMRKRVLKIKRSWVARRESL